MRSSAPGKRFARLGEFFIDDRGWQGMREDFFAALVCSPIAIGYWVSARRRAEAYERFLKTGGAEQQPQLPELILACIVYWRAWEISQSLGQCNPLTNGVDTSLLEHDSPIEWANVVLYDQYVLDRKLVRRHSTKDALKDKLHEAAPCTLTAKAACAWPNLRDLTCPSFALLFLHP